MLDKRNQGRAISFCDGGRAGGDAFFAQICICSRFVLYWGRRGRVVIARFLATLMAGVTVGISVGVSSEVLEDRRLVSPWSLGCACRVTEGADTGSDTASSGASRSGSPRNMAPGKL
jgi:hypothetical protein